MTFFGKDLVRALVLGFALGSTAMAVTLFSAEPAQAAAAAPKSMPVSMPVSTLGTGR